MRSGNANIYGMQYQDQSWTGRLELDLYISQAFQGVLLTSHITAGHRSHHRK